MLNCEVFCSGTAMPIIDEAAWATAAESGDVEKLKTYISKGGAKVQTSKAQEAMVAAALFGQVEALQVLLDYKTSPDCKDSLGRNPLHTAATEGHHKAVALLVNARANIELRNADGATAMAAAIRAKRMLCCKELLKGGATLPAGEIAAGLAAVIKEVQLEKISAELIEFSEQPEVRVEAIQEVEPKVWEYQREHMALLKLREEQRAGKQLISFAEREKLQLEAAERSKLEQDAHDKFIREKRVELQSLRGQLVVVVKDLQAVTSTEMEMQAQDERLRAEIQERQDELSVAESRVIASDEASKGERARLDLAEARWKVLEGEIAQKRAYNEMEEEELKAAQKELEGWQRDREAAAKLTAQAHKLLGN